MNLRKITSMTMMVSFVLLVITSIILYLVPHGRVAYWSDWHLFALTKTQWGNLHINLGFLFLLAGVLHIFYNWRPLLAYMKNKSRKLKIFTASFNIALVISLLVGFGTLAEIPPMSTIINFGETLKEQSAEKYGEPPYGHAELSSLKLFSKRTSLELDMALRLLDKAGIRIKGSEQSIKEISQHNNLTPKALFEIIKPAQKQQDTKVTFPDSPPPGFGRKTLQEICHEYGIESDPIIAFLSQKGVTAKAEQTFKEIADENDMDAHFLFEILHQAVVR